MPMLVVKRCVALVLSLLVGVAGAHGLDAPGPAGLGQRAKVVGRVIDDAGRPVEGVRVTATGEAMGKELATALSHRDPQGNGVLQGVSGPDGRFTIDVPYADVRYSLFVHLGQPYHQDRERPRPSALSSNEPEPVEVVVDLMPVARPVMGRVLGIDGRPAIDRTVTLISEFGQRWQVKTDEAGRFIFDGMRMAMGTDTDVLVEGEGEVGVAVLDKRQAGNEVEIRLARPASVSGQVRAADSGELMAGVVVRIGVKGSSQLNWSTTTDREGRYTIEGVPPVELYCAAYSKTHYNTPAADAEAASDARLPALEPGKRTTYSGFNMQPVAVLRGRFIDQNGVPVPNALVCIRSHYHSDRSRHALVYTDKEGRFELYSGFYEYNYGSLEAYHPMVGTGWQHLDRLSPGQVTEDITLQAYGSARVSGRVTDGDGKPLAGIRCLFAHRISIMDTTDADGRYDLGMVPLWSNDPEQPDLYPICFLPPRPKATFVGEPPAEPGPFYVEQGHWLKLLPDDVAEQDARLQETRRLVLMGAVGDEPKQRAGRSRVFMMRGAVDPETEAGAQRVEGLMKHLYPEEPTHLSIGVHRTHDTDYLFETHADDRGRWGMSLLATDTDGWRAQAAEHGFVHPDQSGAAPREALDAVTVIVVRGKGDYTLYPPTQIVADQSRYTLPTDAARQREHD